MFESEEAIRKNVQQKAAGLDRAAVAAREKEARRRYETSTPGHCFELTARREQLERYAGAWRRVLDGMTDATAGADER
ncbi:hypothetical protein [Streptomyces sp. NPDC057854]|uniref:hypothetical protein n=1 Tax=unclassified Streptomyces TaxID=2593676 RepID=UPI003698184F